MSCKLSFNKKLSSPKSVFAFTCAALRDHTSFLFCPSSNRCTKIINADSEDPKYIINVKQFAKFVVDLSDQVAPTDIEEGMRVG